MSEHGIEELFRAEAHARLAAIVESSDDAIVSKSLDGVILTWNRGAERIFGYTAAEAVGRPITILIPPDRQHEEPQILARLRAGERIDHYETVRIAKDGRYLDVSVTISPVRDATGRIVAASKVARDVTEQRRALRELKAAKEAAETASRAKDQFLSVLSHELRTPLTPVLAAVSFLATNPNLTAADLRDQLDVIRRNVETEARLVDDLLDMTSIARGKVRLHFEVTDAHAALRNTVATFRSELDAKGLSVTLALSAGDHHVWADPGRLQQVLLNLMSNAVKFTPAGGAIDLRTADAGGRLRIEVADSGTGIEPDVLDRMFNVFEQGERTITRRFGGLGLGLAIVRSLVEMHEGSVTATSGGTNRGATFTVELPTVPPQPHGAPAEAAAGATLGGGTPAGAAREKPRILLVEDHADTRHVLARLLQSAGCAVTTAGSAREAMELADRAPFDLLVSDIGLPDGSGLDVMRYVKARHNLKGIALTGFGQDDDLARSSAAGFETHLTKPVNFQMLKEVIRRVAV
jgi:PAS domain S-box-containing protein